MRAYLKKHEVIESPRIKLIVKIINISVNEIANNSCGNKYIQTKL